MAYIKLKKNFEKARKKKDVRLHIYVCIYLRMYVYICIYIYVRVYMDVYIQYIYKMILVSFEIQGKNKCMCIYIYICLYINTGLSMLREGNGRHPRSYI
jgi:hypothetical protein